MGRWRVVLPIMLAVLIALLGSFLAYKWMKRQAVVTKEPKAMETVPVAVAAIDLPWGTKLADTQIKLAPFLKDTLPAGYFTDPALVSGRVLLRPVKEKEPILESKLAPTTVTTGGVSAVIEPGKRAIAVKGDKVLGLSGLIQAGNRVDVLVTVTDPEAGVEVTKIVLEHIPVLATGTQMVKNEKGEAAPVDVYTLEVTPEEGEKLALASTQGRLQFALRNFVDMDTVLTRGATIQETLAAYRAKVPQVIPRTAPGEAQKSPPAAITRSARVVEVVKGTTVTKMEF